MSTILTADAPTKEFPILVVGGQVEPDGVSFHITGWPAELPMTVPQAYFIRVRAPGATALTPPVDGEVRKAVEQLHRDANNYKASLYYPDTDKMFSDDPVATLAYQWQDKKHRHVDDLCCRLREAAELLTRLSAENAQLTARLADVQKDRDAAQVRAWAAAFGMHEWKSRAVAAESERDEAVKALAIEKRVLAKVAVGWAERFAREFVSAGGAILATIKEPKP